MTTHKEQAIAIQKQLGFPEGTKAKFHSRDPTSADPAWNYRGSKNGREIWAHSISKNYLVMKPGEWYYEFKLPKGVFTL